MSQHKIIPGMVCILDHANEFKFDETAPVTVTIEKLHKRNAFKGKVWEVSYEELDTVSMTNKKCILYVPEKYLIPEFVYVVRNPIGMPTINDIDIQVINIAIKNTQDKKQRNRLELIKAKLDLFKSLREV